VARDCLEDTPMSLNSLSDIKTVDEAFLSRLTPRDLSVAYCWGELGFEALSAISGGWDWLSDSRRVLCASVVFRTGKVLVLEPMLSISRRSDGLVAPTSLRS
jgi:hypothetical protein